MVLMDLSTGNISENVDIKELKPLKLRQCEYNGQYHSEYDDPKGNGWWNAYCVYSKYKKFTPTPTDLGDILNHIVYRIDQFEPYENKDIDDAHKLHVQGEFRKHRYNVITCRCGCCQGAEPTLYYEYKNEDELCILLKNMQSVKINPCPSYHIFVVNYLTLTDPNDIMNALVECYQPIMTN